ncbi:MAG: hypothetical protein OEZ47_16015, partial [Gammaproteobacteria bacterium]|nr:hypothetical protein [Gammaproteobacteria bacterium]
MQIQNGVSVGQAPQVSNTESPAFVGRLIASDLFFPLVLALGIFAIYFGGNLVWDTRRYDATDGWGYWAGIVGGVFILIAVFYALFKHMSRLRSLGFNRNMLRIHIAFGILGPLIVLIHSGLQVKSLNGTIALYSVIAVYISGVVGRYLYSKVHRYQDKTKKEFQQWAKHADIPNRFPEISDSYQLMVRSFFTKQQTLLGSIGSLLSFDVRAINFRHHAKNKKVITSKQVER